MSLDLIEISTTLGGIAECNSQYTDGLIRRIKETGKAVEDLTVKELLSLHEQHGRFFNSLYKA